MGFTMRTLAINEINNVSGGNGDHTATGSPLLRDHTQPASSDYVVRYGYGNSVWIETNNTCELIRRGDSSSTTSFGSVAASVLYTIGSAVNSVTNWVQNNCQAVVSVGVGRSGVDGGASVDCTVLGGDKK
jgi:hypothetical protein